MIAKGRQGYRSHPSLQYNLGSGSQGITFIKTRQNTLMRTEEEKTHTNKWWVMGDERWVMGDGWWVWVMGDGWWESWCGYPCILNAFAFQFRLRRQSPDTSNIFVKVRSLQYLKLVHYLRNRTPRMLSYIVRDPNVCQLCNMSVRVKDNINQISQWERWNLKYSYWYDSVHLITDRNSFIMVRFSRFCSMDIFMR